MNNNIMDIVLQVAVLLFSVSVHESAHGWMAEKFGDPTARSEGRITLNPIAHIDLMGSVIFPLMLALANAPIFGWAKPVMVNPYNLRDRRKAMMYIAAAGPVSNLIIAFGGMVIFLLLKNVGLAQLAFMGSHSVASSIGMMLISLIMVNIYLAVFNLLPIPPLDGINILEGVLKGEAYYSYQKIKPYGFIILIVIIFTGVLSVIANPILRFVLGILLRG